jgi:hypothetical protein
MAEIWGIAAAAVVGAGISAYGSMSAASTEAGAAENAQQIQQNEFNTITQQETPYMQAGYGAQSQLNYLLGIGTPGTAATAGQSGAPGTAGTATGSTAGNYGSLLTPFTAQDWQQLSPMYNFQLQQGQQGVLNSDAPGQGATSGAALKDLISFNQGTANQSFNNAFQLYQQQQGNVYNRLMGTAQLGQNAAANTGQQGTALAGNMGQAEIAAGNAIGSGISSASNAIGNSLNSYAAYNALGNYSNPNNSAGVGGQMTTYYDAGGNPYQGTVASGGF